MFRYKKTKQLSYQATCANTVDSRVHARDAHNNEPQSGHVPIISHGCRPGSGIGGGAQKREHACKWARCVACHPNGHVVAYVRVRRSMLLCVLVASVRHSGQPPVRPHAVPPAPLLAAFRHTNLYNQHNYLRANVCAPTLSLGRVRTGKHPCNSG